MRAWVAAGILGVAAIARGEGESARAEPSTGSVRLGEPFDYTVALRHGKDETVALAPLPPLAPFSVRALACRTTTGERDALSVCTLQLQLLDLGEHEVPALALRVRGPGGERLVPAPGARVRGLSATDPRVPGASLQLKAPPAPPVKVPSWRYVSWAGGVLLALLLAWLLWRAWRRRGREGPVPLLLPPHERFEKRIGEIVHLDLHRRGRGREHVDRLADAAREYLAAIAPAAHLDLTSAEVIVALGERPVPGLDPQALGAFLSAADLVKFARHDPAAAECQEATDFARALLERTRPAPEVTTAMTPPRPGPGGPAASGGPGRKDAA